MDEKTAKQKLKKLKRFAYSHVRKAEDREDFIQYAMLRMLEGSTQNIRFLWADYFRELYGRNRAGLAHGDFQQHENDVFYSWEPVILGYKNRVAHAVFLLKHLWEFDTREIAKLFDVSDGWVSQKLKQATDFYKTNIK